MSDSKGAESRSSRVPGSVQELRRDWQAGFEAYGRGAMPSACPHRADKAPDRQMAWLRGYTEAEFQANPF